MKTPVFLFALLFVSYAYFYQAGGWNQNSRFDLVRAMTNEHSLRIDPFQLDTGDKAFFEGHYYSDKAPGLAFMAVPTVAIVRPFMRMFGGDPESYGGIAFLSYLSTVLTVGLLTALAGVRLYFLCRTLGATSGGALFAALTFGLGTPMWSLATLFIGHAAAAACLVFAFGAAMDLRGVRGTRDLWLGAIVGLGAGWATVCDFTAAVPAVLLAVLTTVNVWPLGSRRAFRVLGALVVTALVCATILMAYQYACFGSPFHLAYASEQGFEGLQQGVFGVQTPRLIRLRRLLFGSYRGLFPLAPALAVAPIGLLVLAWSRINRTYRLALSLAAVIAVYYILWNASYTYWEGGWSYGPRHLSPAIPFLCLGLAGLWSRAPRFGRLVLAGLGIWGAALSLIAVSTMAQPPASIREPVSELLVPAFRDGDLALNTQRFTDGGGDAGALRAHVDPKAAWNLGMKLGLSGRASLLPLVVVWLFCGLGLKAGTRSRAPGPPARVS
ncbi:MAG TPA: hypothetical protein VNZ26_34220 [Vicinamibacterales bacterium]|nr:hypothetical protein [Vicinamibacterales bacterium]